MAKMAKLSAIKKPMGKMSLPKQRALPALKMKGVSLSKAGMKNLSVKPQNIVAIAVKSFKKAGK